MSNRNIFPCTLCSKHCNPKATECRWCGADLFKGEAAANAPLSPAVVRELEEVHA